MRMCCCRQLIGPLSCTTSCCSQKNLQQYNELQLAVLLPPKVLELLLKSSSYKLHIQWKTASILLKWSLFRVVSLRTMLCVLGTLWSHLHSYTITPGSGSLQPQCDLPATEQLHWGIMLKDTSLVVYFRANPYPAGSRDCFVLFTTDDLAVQIYNKAFCIRTISEKKVSLERPLGH